MQLGFKDFVFEVGNLDLGLGQIGYISFLWFYFPVTVQWVSFDYNGI